MLRFRRMRSLQKFESDHASVCNHFNQERSLSSRPCLKLNSTAALVEGIERSLRGIRDSVIVLAEIGSN